MGTKCEPGAKSGASSSSDDDPDVPESSEVFISTRDLPSTEKMKRLVKYYGIHRDKESLLEELLSLKDALDDQQYHLKLHKGHHDDMEAQNRALSKQIEFLETGGLQAALTGTLTKLRAKLRACEFQISDLETTIAMNKDQVRNLRMNTQFMRTQEAAVARELFALEVRRLQRCLFHLARLYKKVNHDNEAAARLKAKIPELTDTIPEQQASLSVRKKSLEALAAKSAEWTTKGAAAKKAFGYADSRFNSLQNESKSIMDQLFSLKEERARLNGEKNSVSYQARMAEREAREKAQRVEA